MDDNLAILLLMAMAMLAAVTVIVLPARMRARRALLDSERGAGQLEERVAVLERIATDPAERTAREIEELR